MIEPIEPGEHSYLKEINRSSIVNWNPTKSVKPSELAHLEMLNEFQHKHKRVNGYEYAFEDIDKYLARLEIKKAMSNSVSGKHCPRKYGNYSGTLNY